MTSKTRQSYRLPLPSSPTGRARVGVPEAGGSHRALAFPMASPKGAGLGTAMLAIAWIVIGFLGAAPGAWASTSEADSQGPPSKVDAELRGRIVEEISGALLQTYIFADKAEEMASFLQQRLGEGAYDDATDLPTLAGRLTDDLRSVSHDLHLSVDDIPAVQYSAEGEELSEDERHRRYLEQLRSDNFGFHRVERLAGNVGYIDLRSFAPAEEGGRTAVAAMGFLSEVDALIFDVRNNGGGAPSMVQLLTSYLLEGSEHLNSFYVRETDETQQFWSHAHVDGKKRPDMPVYVLTSDRTFSAAEEFSYNLRHLERATLVGETTGGGAHPVNARRWPELGIGMFLPYGRAVNPISGTNWEGTGVEPHIAVDAERALGIAHAKALETMMGSTGDADRRRSLTWALEDVRAKASPTHLEAAALEAFVGTFGPRTISFEEGALLYQRASGPVRALRPMGNDLFALEGVDYFRLRFERDGRGRVVTLVGLYQDGREEPNARNTD